MAKSTRSKRREPTSGDEPVEPPNQYAWIAYAVATLLVGGLGGYVLSLQNSPGPTAPAATTATVPAESVPVVNETELRAYRDILSRDPANVAAATKAGNLLFDGQRYAEAIPFYQQAFAGSSSDVNISTDLGTALWYSGRPAEALAQYDRSLAIEASHAQTLFNMGIVRADGTHDYPGAIASWETLLKANPGYPDAAKVQARIADARQKLGATKEGSGASGGR